MGVGAAERLDRSDNRGGIIRYNADFFEVDTDCGQLPCKVIHIGVAGAPRQDFVANYKHRGGGVTHGGSPVGFALL